MSNDPLRIHLSLVSHTNIGKTTLARTLLSRDIGEVADRAHVTETTDDYVLARNAEGCELVLWDTPGFGNSVALAKRLEGRANPVGWFLSEVWDRMANKSLWLNQKALKHVKETSSVVQKCAFWSGSGSRSLCYSIKSVSRNNRKQNKPM